eukprot:8580579-Pyramimonas_sp.AAC.1
MARSACAQKVKTKQALRAHSNHEWLGGARGRICERTRCTIANHCPPELPIDIRGPTDSDKPLSYRSPLGPEPETSFSFQCRSERLCAAVLPE